MDGHTVCEELMEKRGMYICSLYGKSGADVNDARYASFCKESSQLPPTKDAISKHTSRANIPGCYWRQALDARPYVPAPHGHGWILRSGRFDGSTAST